MNLKGKSIVVMGVSGCGKSTFGEHLAAKLSVKFIDGDDLHTRSNLQKMAIGQALNDTDRKPWLERISDVAYSIEHKQETAVIVCSALKKHYRDQIREGNGNLVFVFLDGSKDLITKRMEARKGHFMKVDMLESQFAAFERPVNEEDIITISIDQSIPEILDACVTKLNSQGVVCAES